MNEGLIPSRYAKALYKFACEKDASRGLYALMGQLEQSFAQNPGLGQMMANPFVDDARKAELLRVAAGLAADVSSAKGKDTTGAAKGKDAAGADNAAAVFADFLKLLHENRRLEMARDIARAYGDIYRRENRIYRVRIVSAQALDAPEKARLEKLIQSHLKDATEEYTYSVDPGLIGGFTIDIENERLDASVKNELKQLRLKLLAH